MQPFCAPPVRRMRVSRRVSMSAMATVPSRCRYCGSVSAARKLDTRNDASLTINPAGLHLGRFDVLVVGADVADVRVRQRDDLPAVAGVGQDFLVAGHRGVEHHFADRVAGGADRGADEGGSVREGKQGFGQDGKQNDGSGLRARRPG